MNTTTKLTILAAAALPTTLCAQSLFHAPLPPQQQMQQPAQQQPAPAPAPAAPAPTPAQQPAAGSTPEASNSTPSTPSPTQPTPAPAPSQAAVLPPPAVTYQPVTAQQVSLFAVKPILPRKYNKQDKVEIIINESSLQKFDQNFDGKESNNASAGITDFPDVAAIFSDGILVNNGKPTLKIGAANKSDYKGDGSYERKEKFTARISAIVTDVKPNGMLVLEARETILSDRESQSMVVSGLCDPKDITDKNTVTSSQLANLVIKKENGGDVKDAATKGWFPRVFDALTGSN